jgi:hypothetical protein
VSTRDPSQLTFISTGSADADRLARSLGAGHHIAAPAPPAAIEWQWDWGDDLDAWTADVSALPTVDHVVVCAWSETAVESPLVEIHPVAWRREVEWPTALWFVTLAAAVGRCRDGGSVAVVVDRPATLDSVGRASVVTVADGVVNLVRSLAAQEGRRVRVNAVLTEREPDGRNDGATAGVVRLLLSDDALGITGSATSVAGGRG